MVNTHNMDPKTKKEIEDLVKGIFEKEFDRMYQKVATKYGVSDTPLHKHNGIDAPTIPNSSLSDFLTLPANGNGVLSPDNLAGYTYTVNTGQGSPSNPPTVKVPQVPIIYGSAGGAFSDFLGGDAPEGSMIFFNNGAAISTLWIRSGGSWFGLGQSTAGWTNTII